MKVAGFPTAVSVPVDPWCRTVIRLDLSVDSSEAIIGYGSVASALVDVHTHSRQCMCTYTQLTLCLYTHSRHWMCTHTQQKINVPADCWIGSSICRKASVW